MNEQKNQMPGNKHNRDATMGAASPTKRMKQTRIFKFELTKQ
jgi:hypothetical protein